MLKQMVDLINGKLRASERRKYDPIEIHDFFARSM